MKKDTRILLQYGGGILLVGVLSALLTATVFGGLTKQGPHTSLGWLGLMVAMCCLPMGVFLFLLGMAKWLKEIRE